MKMRSQLGLLLGAVAALTTLPACWTYSLHPLYGDDDPQITYVPSLNGAWRSDKDDFRLVIAGDSKQRHYTLSVDDPSSGSGDRSRSEVQYDGYVISLGAQLFLDAEPSGDGVPGAILAHSIFKISLQSDTLYLSPISDDWLCSAPEAERELLGQCVHGDFVLTASTDVLQDLIRDHSDDEAMFPTADEEEGLHRIVKAGSGHDAPTRLVIAPE